MNTIGSSLSSRDASSSPASSRAVKVADFYWVRGGDPADPRAETENWAGTVRVLLASAVAIALIAIDVMPPGFMVSLAIVFVLYPTLRMSLLRAGTSPHSRQRADHRRGRSSAASPTPRIKKSDELLGEL